MAASDVYIPQVVNNFNVYDNANNNRFLGVTDEVTLPDIQMKTTSVDQAGTAGEFDLPIPGQLQSMTSTINFHSINQSYWSMVKKGGKVDITLRGSILNTNASDASVKNVGVVIIEKGLWKQSTNGSLKKSDSMGASNVMEVLYYKVTYDGKELCEIDKLNNICKINGIDHSSDISSQI